jgi:adenine-specific DNA-methyltransferase
LSKKVASKRHKADTHAHIPSKEEAGYEDANKKLSNGKKVLELHKNPYESRHSYFMQNGRMNTINFISISL